MEQRLSALEEFTREWVDPNVLGNHASLFLLNLSVKLYSDVAQNTLGKANGKRGIGRSCPAQFFPIDDTDPNSPCYHISLVPNYRKNWQVL